MNRFDTVRPGQPLQLPAATWNEMLAMLIWWRGQGPAAAPRAATGRELDVIKLRNDSGQALNAYSVLGIGDPIFSPDDDEEGFKFRQPAFVGEQPQRADHYRKFAVLLAPAAEGAIVDAAVDGLVVCLLDVADEHHTHADVADEETLLQTGVCGGAKILWKESGAGEKWALIQLGAPLRTALAKAAAEIDAAEDDEPGVGEVTEWTFDGDSLVASSLEFDAYNPGTEPAPADELLQLIEIGDRMVIALPGEGGEGGTKIYRAQLNGELEHDDATATIDNVESLDSSNPPSPTSAVNDMHLAGADNDACYIVRDTSGETTVYRLLQVRHYECDED